MRQATAVAFDEQHLVQARIEDLMGLDLGTIKRKLMLTKPEGHGWSEEQAREAELWYRRFLCVMLVNPDHPAVPNAPIDAFWHAHILDTRKYAADCDRLFGRFIHHFPYFGLNGDEAERDTAFDRTNEIYRELFGEECTSMVHFATTEGEDCDRGGVAKGQGCNHSGSGTGCGQGCSRG